MPQIKCTVTECHFNHEVMCNAPMIQVEHNGVPESGNSDQTKCETFKHK